MIKFHPGELLLSLLCVGLIFNCGCNSTGNEAEVSRQPQTELQSQRSDIEEPFDETTESSAEHSWIQDFKDDLNQWPDRLIDDSKDSFLRPENATALLLAGGASIVMNQETDERIADYLERHQKLRNFKDESLNVIGSPTLHLGASGLWYFLAARNNDSINKERAWTLRTALTISWLTTAGLKTARNNRTPNGKSRAWPSGHTSSSFTVASVLDEFYGPKVGIPAYALASLVAYRMMDTGDHWGSDIVFGATLGWVVGHTVASKHKVLESSGYEIMPFISMTEEPATGISLMKRF